MVAAWLALANAGARARPSVWDTRFLWATLVLAVALALGYLLIQWLERWRKRPVQYRLSAADELAQYRVLYERGELSQEEFDRIQATLGRPPEAPGPAGLPPVERLRPPEPPLADRPPAG
jgi:hypothetical protein